MIGLRWGLSPKIIMWLYKTVIRPLFCYGALVWWPRTDLSTVEGKLSRLQRLACMATTGCMKTTPTAALEVMLNLPPLHFHIKQEAALTALRLQNLGLWKNYRAQHTAILEMVYNEYPILMAVCDRIPKQVVFDKKYKIQLHEDYRIEGQNLTELRVFTDGSKTETGTGIGIFSDDLNIKISTPLGAHNTVFQAECMGIIKAAEAILDRKVQYFPIRILSDSLSVLMALNKHEISSGLIYECHHKINKVGLTNPITLQWIKGHSGSRGNDAADELARYASTITAVGPEPIIPVPYGKLRNLLANWTHSKHLEYWTNHPECRQAKEAMPSINSRYSKALLNLKKTQLRQLTAVTTGHGSFNKHLFAIGVTDSPLCRACMEAEETAAHVVIDCEGLASYRATHLGSTGSLPEVICNIRSLLSFLGELGWLD